MEAVYLYTVAELFALKRKGKKGKKVMMLNFVNEVHFIIQLIGQGMITPQVII